MGFAHKLETIRYMAPERLSRNAPWINHLSTKGDVYSIAMTSFAVRSSAVNYPTI
jgi:hypothetical protein